MAHKTGYSLVKLSDNTEYASNGSLPWTLEYPNGRVTLDKVDLIVPDSDNPLFVVKEKWQIDELPTPTEDWRQIGTSAPVWNGTNDRMEVTGIYEELSQVEKDERTRIEELNTDADVVTLKDTVSTKTLAEIQSWVSTNVTNITEAQQMFARIIKYLASSR